MRILLTGATGQLGREVRRKFAQMGWDVTAPARAELDVAAARQIEDAFAAHPFDLVINAAAYTAVDQAETEEALAFRINAEAPGGLARACAASGATLIHVSTDYVFDGTKLEPYTEDDPPCPANAYGRSKEAGERAIRESLDRHIILRTAWLFSAHGHNFVKTMLRLAAERDELRVVADQSGNPTAAADLAWCIGELAKKIHDRRDGNFAWGTYHCTNRGAETWHGFAEAILDEAAPALGRRPVVHPITTADYPTPARRPMNSRLDNAKLKRTFGIEMPSWRPALSRVIDEILNVRLHKSAGS